jgi:hypothetical protein
VKTDALFLWVNMKVSNWDNGLTAEQQAVMDAKWEELLAKVKVVDPKLYKKIQDESLEYFLTDDDVTAGIEDNQYQLNL